MEGDDIMLILANSDQIKITKIPNDSFSGETVEVDAKTLTSRYITPKMKLHMIVYEGFAFETSDN